MSVALPIYEVCLTGDSLLIKIYTYLVSVYMIGEYRKSSRHFMKDDESSSDITMPRYKHSRQKNLQLLHNGYIYCKDSERGSRIYWRCRLFRNGKCGARLITIDDKIVSESRAHTHVAEDSDKKFIEEQEIYEEIV